FDGDLECAYPGQAISVTLEDEIDISRGDWLVAANDEVPLSNAFEADIVWMHDTAMETGKLYDLKLATRDLSGTIQSIDYQIDVNTLEHKYADHLELNAIGRCRVELTSQVPVDDYRRSPGTGSFIAIDRLTNVTVGAGMIRRVAESGGSLEPQVDWQAFELELNALIRKHFPHWEAKDIRDIFKD
ncbi:elongation factor 1-alpha C-terminal domain-related protein, partial [Aidingimonas halophila]